MNTKDKRVLLIEDEADIRDAMAETLEDAGYTVLTAGNGKEGLAIALAEHPDLILLDLMMPVMDGKTMLQKLRADAWGRSAKVMVLSTMDDVTNIATSHEHSIEDYIIKSHASLDEVVRKVRLAMHTD